MVQQGAAVIRYTRYLQGALLVFFAAFDAMLLAAGAWRSVHVLRLLLYVCPLAVGAYVAYILLSWTLGLSLTRSYSRQSGHLTFFRFPRREWCLLFLVGACLALVASFGYSILMDAVIDAEASQK